MTTLKEKYNKEVVPAMMEKFGYKNKMAVPKIEKVTLNTSFGKQSVAKTGSEREKMMNAIVQDLGLIAGQKPKIVKSKKSIAGFKLRQGLEIACMVTLRKQRMWDFMERLVQLSLPRSRDFKGINLKSVDINFPEIFTEKEKTIFGLEINISTTAKTREEGLELFRLMGFPMKDN